MCSISPDISEENRHYWKLEKLIPTIEGSLDYASYEIQGNQWEFRLQYNMEEKLCFKIYRKCMTNISSSFTRIDPLNVRVGVCEESQEEIAVSRFRTMLFMTDIECIVTPLNRWVLESLIQTNKVLYVFIEVTSFDDGKTKDAKSRKRKLEKDYEELLLSGENSDLTLEVNSKKFKCHRSILAARSSVFSAMLKHDMKDKISGVLNVQDAEPTTFQEFLLYLYSGSEEHLNWENVTELYGLADRYAVEDLKDLSIQYMKSNISTKNPLEIFNLTQQMRKLEKDYEELLLSGENSDVTLEVNREKFKCQRSILAARSPVFSAMFKHDMKEKISGVVNVQDAEPTIFQEFLLYLYTGSEKHLNWENVTQLYGLADRYAVEDLKDLSIQYMKSNISTKNFLTIFHVTQQHDEPELSEKMIPFFLRNAKIIMESSEWLTFLCKNPTECNVLFQALSNKYDIFARAFLL